MSEEYFILNDIKSTDKGIVVIELPPIAIPASRIEEIPVLGMDGVLTVTDGTYEPITKECKVYYDGTNYDNLVDFLSNSGNVIFSNLPNRYYTYTITSEIPIQEIIDNEWFEFKIEFRCQPFGYALENTTINIVNKNFKISNIGTYYSKPIITIYGTGDINLLVNGEQVTLKNVEDKITIDSVKMRTYRDTVKQNNKKIGNFPRLERGINNITWDGNVTKIEVIPNWRYLI